MKKYYLLTLEIRSGDATFKSHSVHHKALKKPSTFANRYARTFRGDYAWTDDDEGNGAWYRFDNGAYAVRVDSIVEVTKKQAETIGALVC